MGQFSWPINPSTVTATNPSVSPTGDPIPDEATLVGGEDPSGNLAALQVNAAGELLVVQGGSSDPFEVNLEQVSGVAITLGQKAMTASLPVVLPSDQSAIPVTQSGTWTVQPGNTANTTPWLATINQGGNSAVVTAGGALTVEGTVTANQGGTWNINNVSGTVSLPTGAATETTLSSINTKTPDLGQAAMAASVPVTIANNQSNVPANITQVGGSSLALGQTTMSASVPVVFASNQTALPTSNGRSLVTSARNVYSSVNVTTGAWVQLVASLSAQVNEIYIFDSSGQTMELGVGAAASEARVSIIVPGGNERVPLQIASGARVSVRAISATASVGELDVNFYS